jgi:hypothetical protein
MIKAVHRDSRELDIVRYLSAPAQQQDPTNHCIRKLSKQTAEIYLPSQNLAILDLIDAPQDDLCFIVMEEWSANLFPETPVSLGYLVESLRHCIEVRRKLIEFVYHIKRFPPAYCIHASSSHRAL